MGKVGRLGAKIPNLHYFTIFTESEIAKANSMKMIPLQKTLDPVIVDRLYSSFVLYATNMLNSRQC